MPERVGLVVVHQHRRAGGAEVDPVSSDLDRLVIVEAMPCPLFGSRGYGVLNQSSGVEKPSRVVEAPARVHYHLHELGNGRAHSHAFQKAKGGVVDLLHLRRRQGLVLPPRESGSHRAFVCLQRSSAFRDAPGTSA